MTGLAPRYVASVLIDTFQSLSREGVPVYHLKPDIIQDLFRSLNEGKFAKEAMPDVLRTLATDPLLTLSEALSKAGISTMSMDELRSIIDQIVRENSGLLKAKGRDGAQKALMGSVMQKVRGKVDGKVVNESLAERLTAFEKEEQGKG